MINFAGKLAATIAVAASIGSFANDATAAPATSGALALKNAVPTTVESVYWRRRGYGYGYGGVGAGFVAGAIIGGALAAPYYGYGYGPGPYYYAPPPPPPPGYGAPAAPVAGDAVAYCMQRFKSYDPNSGTYLGFDGQRHPCP